MPIENDVRGVPGNWYPYRDPSTAGRALFLSQQAQSAPSPYPTIRTALRNCAKLIYSHTGKYETHRCAVGVAEIDSRTQTPARRRGRPWKDKRPVLERVLWILRTGAQWAELPTKFPPYQTCHRRFQHWVRAGVLVELLRALAKDLMSSS